MARAPKRPTHSKPARAFAVGTLPSKEAILEAMADAPHLDGKHAVFGEVTKGQDVVNAIKQGDKIKTIDVLDSTDELFAEEKANLDKWNKVLG